MGFHFIVIFKIGLPRLHGVLALAYVRIQPDFFEQIDPIISVFGHAVGI